MLPDDDGGYVCLGNPRHVALDTRRQPPLEPEATACYSVPSSLLCPICEAGMEYCGGGTWACSANADHLFMSGAALRPPEPLPPLGPSPLIDRAAPYWLAHLGLAGPLLYPPQSNSRLDYSIIEGPPDWSAGGGSKSGRRRKKPPKKKKAPEQWKDAYQ